MPAPKKALGQHWLNDEASLLEMVAAGGVTPDDTVVEVGPGEGSLTRYLSNYAKRVIAIEYDEDLLPYLKKRFAGSNVDLVNADIARFNLNDLPAGYKVVANIPYYITSGIIKQFLESANRPARMALLVQKEVAERIVAEPGGMSVLAFSVQYYAEPTIRTLVPKELFTPPPKVDSAILQITPRPVPAFPADRKLLFRLVKAGFGERRKQLLNSLAGGLHLDKEEVRQELDQAGVAVEARAQELSMAEWARLYHQFERLLY